MSTSKLKTKISVFQFFFFLEIHFNQLKKYQLSVVNINININTGMKLMQNGKIEYHNQSVKAYKLECLQHKRHDG